MSPPTSSLAEDKILIDGIYRDIEKMYSHSRVNQVAPALAARISFTRDSASGPMLAHRSSMPFVGFHPN